MVDHNSNRIAKLSPDLSKAAAEAAHAAALEVACKVATVVEADTVAVWEAAWPEVTWVEAVVVRSTSQTSAHDEVPNL